MSTLDNQVLAAHDRSDWTFDLTADDSDDPVGATATTTVVRVGDTAIMVDVGSGAHGAFAVVRGFENGEPVPVTLMEADGSVMLVVSKPTT